MKGYNTKTSSRKTERKRWRFLDLFGNQKRICKIKKLEFDSDKAFKQIEKIKKRNYC